MAVISKKSEKAFSVLESMANKDDLQEFKDKFKEKYPDDWKKINKAFVKEERKTKPGKSHPMPSPDKYLENTYKVVKAQQK